MKASNLKYVVFLLIWTILFQTGSAQIKIPPELAVRLQDKTKLNEIMNEVELFYNNGKNISPGEAEPQYLHWKRWEYWAKRRLMPDGTVGDYNKMNVQGFTETEQKFGEQMRNENLRRAPQNIQPGNITSSQFAYGDWFFNGHFNGGSSTGTNADIYGLGRCDRIFFHPSDANTIFTGTPNGGIWKTANGGTNWSCISNGLPVLGVAGLVVSPDNADVIYVLSGDGDSHVPGYFVYAAGYSPSCQGVFKTTNGGITWTKTGDLHTGASDFAGHKLAIAGSNGNFLFAATNRGVYRTINGGSSWELVRNGEYYDIEFKPGNDSIVYISKKDSVFYSTNGGRIDTWNASTFDYSITSSNRIELGVRRNNSGQSSSYVYAICGRTAGASFTGLFRSTNNGVDFSRRCNTPNILGGSTTGNDVNEQSQYDLCISVKPTDDNYLVTGGLCVWKSDGSNGGSTMIYSTVYRESLGIPGEYIHPDIHDLEYNPVNGWLYAATDGGIYRSTDNGVSWMDLSLYVTATQYYHFKMRDADADGYMDGFYMLGGAQDNGIKFRNNSQLWKHVYCCDGFDGVINSDDPQKFFFNVNDRIYRTTDGGVNVSFRRTVSFFSPMAMDWANPDTIYVASNDKLVRTYDGFELNSTEKFINIKDLVTTCPSNSARIFGARDSFLFKSDDRGDNWANLSNKPGWPAGITRVTDCKPFPSNSSRIVVSIGGYTSGKKIYYSGDDGDNWSNFSGSLPNVAFHCVSVTDEGVYAGSDIGVFFRGWTMTDWTPFYNGLPRVPVSDIWAGSTDVYCSTFGRGIWRSGRYSACPATLTLMAGNYTGPRYFEASNSIDASFLSEGGAGTEIFTKAGNSVVLSEGFEIKNETFFKAYLGPCASGGIPTTSLVNDKKFTYLESPVIELNNGKRKPRIAENYFIQKSNWIEIHLKEPGIVKIKTTDKNQNTKYHILNKKFRPGLYWIILDIDEFLKAEVLINDLPVNELIQNRINPD